MIRRLRNKFLLAAIAAVFLVLLVLIGSINALNYRSLVREADGTLEILALNKGSFPRQMFRPLDEPAEGKDAPPDINPAEMPGLPRGGSGSASRPRNRALEMASGDYVLFFDPDDECLGDAYSPDRVRRQYEPQS